MNGKTAVPPYDLSLRGRHYTSLIKKVVEEIEKEIKSKEEYEKQEKIYTIVVLILIFELILGLSLFSFGFLT